MSGKLIEIEIVLNILLILGIILCQVLTKFKASPKIISVTVAFLCGSLAIYSLFMIIFGFKAFLALEILRGLACLFFAVIPFVIGSFSTYKKEFVWTTVQQIVLLGSLWMLL